MSLKYMYAVCQMVAIFVQASIIQASGLYNARKIGRNGNMCSFSNT